MNDMTPQPHFQPPALPPAMGEIAATAAAATARALVEARTVAAWRRPRNLDQVRQNVLAECRDPEFARDGSTYYNKPIGKGVKGLGVRFAESFVRGATNIAIDVRLQYVDAEKEVHRVEVSDLESTIPLGFDVIVSRNVERSKPMDDGSYISVRRNSFGNLVYTVPATDDELLNKRLALISKARRNLVLQLCPIGLQREAIRTIMGIRNDDAAKDPAAERKAIADGFNHLGVRATQIADYLGHDIGGCSPDELVDLRELYQAIKEGDTTWNKAMEARRDEKESAGDDAAGTDSAAETATKPPTSAQKVKDAIRARAKGKGAPEPDPAATGPSGADGGPAGGVAAGGTDAPAMPTAEQLRERVMQAKDRDAAWMVLDTVRGRSPGLSPQDHESLVSLIDQRFPDDTGGQP